MATNVTLERVVQLGKPYIAESSIAYLAELPILASECEFSGDAVAINLPSWARDIGVGECGELMAPAACLVAGEDEPWRRVDWWRAVFDLATCVGEREHEKRHGIAHSYALRLRNVSPVFRERAWVNRIWLFLRRWGARQHGVSESALFGDLPRARVHLVHDVDYLGRTYALRFKQTAFNGFNLARTLVQGRFNRSGALFRSMLKSAIGKREYWMFPEIAELERCAGVNSTWNFYAGPGGFARSLREQLLDPAYRVGDQRLTQQIRALHADGNVIGLHQGFNSWASADAMRAEKVRLEAALGQPVVRCRQHWLRFSFEHTWRAQEAAGFELDTTLGYNDKPGFRNAAALHMPIWDSVNKRFSSTLHSVPTVMMDSHLFDYRQLEPAERRRTIDYYLDELEVVGGEAAFCWHQRVFHRDYGWGEEYAYLLEEVIRRGMTCA